MTDWPAVLEATALATALRDSVWVYPLINAAHILGVALLVGAIVPLDLRLLGTWPETPLAPLWRVLTRMATAGLAVAIVAGGLLFVTRAVDYVGSALFLSKMTLVAVGLANVAILYGFVPTGPPSNRPPLRVRVAAGVSLAVWPGVAVLGRLVGYF